MREVGVLEAKTQLSSLLESVERGGEDIMITRHGKPVARLSGVGAEPPRVRKLGGEELAERFERLREQIARENPEIEKISWEELKKMARE